MLLALYMHLALTFRHDSQLGFLLSHFVFFARHNSHAERALFLTDVVGSLELMR
jgi:hypothetical protein